MKRYSEILKMRESRYWKKLPQIMKLLGIQETVGAIALDSEGNVAATSSTGGIWLKMPGRVGDSAIVGAGFYADNRGGAASASGIGEIIMLHNVCRRVVELLIQGLQVDEALRIVVENVTNVHGPNTVGVIALNTDGYASARFNTMGMARAVMARNLDKPRIAFFDDRLRFCISARSSVAMAKMYCL